jgi:AbrB family looped-hinge helix DNA binding protein
MRTTIDQAGRIVVPAAHRAQLGLVPGPVEIVADGSGIRIEPVIADQLEIEQGIWSSARTGHRRRPRAPTCRPTLT